MPYASSINAYPDVRAALERALASPKGIKLSFKEKTDAISFRGRIHSFRYLERRENKKIYPEDHVLYSSTPYDPLMVKTIDATTIMIIKLSGDELNIEELE